MKLFHWALGPWTPSSFQRFLLELSSINWPLRWTGRPVSTGNGRKQNARWILLFWLGFCKLSERLRRGERLSFVVTQAATAARGRRPFLLPSGINCFSPCRREPRHRWMSQLSCLPNVSLILGVYGLKLKGKLKQWYNISQSVLLHSFSFFWTTILKGKDDK